MKIRNTICTRCNQLRKVIDGDGLTDKETLDIANNRLNKYLTPPSQEGEKG